MSSAVINKGGGFIQGIVLARLLGAESLGEWGMLQSVLALGVTLAVFGLSTTATKYTASLVRSHNDDLSVVLGGHVILTMVFGATLVISGIVLSDVIAASLLSAPQLVFALKVFSVVVLLNAIVSVLSGILAGLEHFRFLTIVESFSSVMGVSLVLSLAAVMHFDGAVLGFMLGRFITMLAVAFLVVRLLRRYGLRIEYKRSIRSIPAILKPALPVVWMGILAVPGQFLVLLALANQDNGYSQVGGFYAANQWRTIAVFLPHQILVAFLPIMASLAADHLDDALSLHRRMLWFVFFVALIVCLSMVVFPGLMLKPYGADFAGFELTLVILVVKAFFESLASVSRRTILALDGSWLLAIPEVASLLFVVTVGLPFLIPSYQAEGAASTLLIAQLVQFFLLMAIFRVLVARRTTKSAL
jgi:O-antigen/teichoic acid export membrane protein